jgi:hypothetical protein
MDLWQFCDFFPGTQVSSSNKTDRNDIIELFVESGIKRHNRYTVIHDTNQNHINCVIMQKYCLKYRNTYLSRSSEIPISIVPSSVQH